MEVFTPTEVIKADSYILGVLTKDDREKTSALVEYFIVDLQNFLNLNRTMNPHQIKETARMILQRYNYMKISDCKYVFDQIKTGNIKIYEGLDGQKILGAFEMWAEERFKTAEHMSYHAHLDKVDREKSQREKPNLLGNPDNNQEFAENYVKSVTNHQEFFEGK